MNKKSRERPTKIKAKRYLSNYKCKYYLTKTFHFQKIILQIYSHAYQVFHYSIICYSKRLEIINPYDHQMETAAFKLWYIYTMGFYTELRKNEESLSALTREGLQTIMLIEKRRVQNSMSNIYHPYINMGGWMQSVLCMHKDSWKDVRRQKQWWVGIGETE